MLEIAAMLLRSNPERVVGTARGVILPRRGRVSLALARRCRTGNSATIGKNSILDHAGYTLKTKVQSFGHRRALKFTAISGDRRKKAQ